MWMPAVSAWSEDAHCRSHALSGCRPRCERRRLCEAGRSDLLHPHMSDERKVPLACSVHLEIEVEGISALKRTDVFGFAFLAIALGPQLIIGVLRELAEAILALGVGDLAHHGERVIVLEIDDSTLKRGAGLIEDFAVNGALHGAAGLREGRDLRQNQAA